MLKNKLPLFYLLVLLFASLLITKTISFFSNSVQSESFNLTMSEWRPAESSLEIIKDEAVYSIDEKIDSQNLSNPQQSFITTQNQYLSFQYKVDSSENASGFDDPNFLLKINGQIILQDTIETGIWKRGFVNLKNHKSSDNNYSLDFISKNTFDEINSPTLALKEVSTSRFLAKENDLLRFTVSKDNAEIYLKYSIEENGLIIQKNQVLVSPYEFLITEHFYNNEIEYYSVDSFGNTEDSKFIIIDTDFSYPATISDLKCFAESDIELSITFTSPIDNFSNLPALYESAVSDSEINEIVDWDLLERVSLVDFKKFGVSSLPSKSGGSENMLFQNIDSEKNYFAIKSFDQSGNSSEISSCFR
ncbi:hypothetical protein KKD03_04395 [Patescibacteria group bacterium]|nr:hypothetical protein [Patescibacteria group bacterium]